MATQIISGIALFESGRDMWDHYDKGIYYNPFENLHLACNTRFNQMRKGKSLGSSPDNNDLIIQARDLLMRIRIQDFFVGGLAEYMWEDINTEFDEIRRDEDPDIPNLHDEWEGFTKAQIKSVVSNYVGLLDPKTMAWIDPEADEVIEKDGVYTYTRLQPVSEVDSSFAYDEAPFLQEMPNTGENLHELAETDFNDYIPNRIRDMYYDYLNDFPY